MEWTIKLEARTGWGEVHTHEIAVVTRRPVGLTADEVGMSLGEAKGLLAEIQRCIVSSQIDEQVMCARVCADCMGLREIRDHRTRTIQTLFGTVVVDAPRLKLCVCVDTKGFKDISISPLSELLPDRCTPELRRTQSELGARHSFREAARLLATFLPCSPQNQSSVRNRLHRTSEELEVADCRSKAKPVSASGAGEIVVFIDGAHIRAVPGHQSRHLDVTVGKVEARGRPPRRFGLAPKGAERPLSNVRAALVEQGWQPGRPVTVISDGEPALPNLVQTAINEPVIHILDWFHISMRIRHIEQSMAGLYAMKPANTAPLDYFAWSIDRLRHVLWNAIMKRRGSRYGTCRTWRAGSRSLTGLDLSGQSKVSSACAPSFVAISATMRTRLYATISATMTSAPSRPRGLKAAWMKSPMREWQKNNACGGHREAPTMSLRSELPLSTGA